MPTLGLVRRSSDSGSIPPRPGSGRIAAPATLLLPLLLVLLPIGARAATPYNSLAIEWTAPGDDGDVGSVSRYQVAYSTVSVGSDVDAWWSAVPSSQRITLFPPLAAAGATDSVRVAGLTPGSTYYFVLIALDEAGNTSDYSNVAVGTTQSCSAPAAAPASFRAALVAGGVDISWDATSDPAALSIHLYRARGAEPQWTLIETLPAAATSTTDASVQPGTTYRYRAAWAGPDIEGVPCEGPASEQAVVTTPPGGSSKGEQVTGRVHAYPNPAAGPVQVAIDVTASQPQSVRVRLFDMAGRWLATVAEGTYPPGRTVVAWDGRGRNGDRLAPGYYEMLGTVGPHRVRERIVLLPE